jgi:hypothetical protein
MNICSVAGYELLIFMFFIIVDDSHRCSSIPNFIVGLCGKLLTYLLFVLCSKSNQLAQISDLQINFVPLFLTAVKWNVIMFYNLFKCFLDSVYTFIFVGIFLCLWWDVCLLSYFLFIDLWLLSWWEFVSCFLACVVLDALYLRTFHPSGQSESSIETIIFLSTYFFINFLHLD